MLNKSHDQIPKKVPSLEEVAEELSFLMPKFFRRMYPYVFKGIDIPPAQVFALMTLEEDGVCTLSKLSKRLNVSPPTASGIINRLVKRGYVGRSQDEKDRRVVNISLTKSGEVIIKSFRKNISEKWGAILKTFSPKYRIGMLLFIKQVFMDMGKNEKNN
jgi:DNA-binding MarR family transcriptional regulator